ncbi:MAG: phosphotransferase [Planctomycetaceae bacterium]|nr:phosphotransferase [Planctomycetaceae bacterium]
MTGNLNSQRRTDLQSLPECLLPLIDRLHEEPVEIIEITTLTGESIDQRSTWRLTFAAGHHLKARVLPASTQLGFLKRSLSALPRDRFPKIIRSGAGAIIEQWFSGEPLTEHTGNAAILKECGEVLGLIHRTPCSSKSGLQNTVCYQHWFESGLYQLLSHGIIELPLARSIHAFATPHRPELTEYGITHRDFCPENLLIHNGLVCSIDNTLLAPRSFDEDLARTWYRWDPSPADWRQILEGYQSARNLASFYRHLNFWCVYVLVKAIEARLQLGEEETARSILTKLQHVIDSPEQELSPLTTRVA